ncbi:FkbM family methyltransferase [Niveispirillum irakense]|uniref:FkbM family methyltransferase n=1 Tax=Niveispirillum irakense TaxID=34011 RepID=UPI00042123E5|nr:FkbM family methyltransferase [Niveispirillum irakense]
MFAVLHKRLRQARKLVVLLGNPRYRGALRHGVGATIEHHTALRMVGTPATILDVGANKGQFSLAARAFFPSARIVAFEPLPDMAERCATIFKGDSAFRVVRAAVGPVAQEMTLHVAGRPDSSSLLPVGEAQARLFPGTRECATLQVPVAPLSSFLEEAEKTGPLLLKIDVQGFELEVLKGAVDILPQVTHAYVEASFIQLYDGQALAADVIAFLDKVGLRLAGIYNLHCDDQGQPVQADFLFQR